MKLSFTIQETSELTGIGKNRIYDAINSGHLRAKKFGRRTIILQKDLELFLDSLATFKKI